jgi:hypothetical protein
MSDLRRYYYDQQRRRRMVGTIGGPGYSAEAQQFFSRISNPDGTRKALYATMIDALVTAGVWAKLDAFYMLAAADAAAALRTKR